MRLDVHHHIELSPQVLDQFNRLHEHLKNMEKHIMAALDDLAADVAAEDTVIDSAVVLLNAIPGLIANAGVDPVKLAALRSDIQAKTATLAAAVATGTPPPAAGAAPITAAAATTAANASVAASTP